MLASASEPHELYTFSTTTVGGQSAIGDLCEAHARTTEGVGQYPVVTLGTGAYDHKIKSRGRVHVPVFRVVDCVEAGPFNAMVAEERGGAGFIPTSPPALSTPDAVAITSGGALGRPPFRRRRRPVSTSVRRMGRPRATMLNMHPSEGKRPANGAPSVR